MIAPISSPDQDIAITGYACRLPGAPNVGAFWSLLRAGKSAISRIGADRWDVTRALSPNRRMPGDSYTFAAGQIDNVWDFDPGHFGISPREAAQMDPQQRLLLEVTAEAIESAGLGPGQLSQARVGVFVGAASSDYLHHFVGDLGAIDGQFMTGNTLSILSNRLSYAFDLRGPSYTVDTACSSSFFALHQAVQALGAGAIDTAIVAGVNLLLSPMAFVGFSRAAMLSPSGLCRAFDAGADGYVRSEGAVALVLRRVAVARERGDRVRGVVVASGVNTDGRTTGLAQPSADRQADLIRAIARTHSLAAEDFAFVEAHGTGTPVGDPIEAQAIGEALGRARGAPLPIGSAKSNVGHLEPASGLVGLLKAVLALENSVLPPSLHVAEVNPAIPMADLNLTVATRALPLRQRGGGRAWLAGVNSFGFGGANAHVVLRQVLGSDLAPAAPAPAPRALVISAGSAAGLTAQVAAWRARLAVADPVEAAALVNAAAWRRGRQAHRLVVLGQDAPALVEGLAAAEADRPGPWARARGTVAAGRGTAFVFSGNGSQWAGMGAQLYATDAVYRAAFDHVSHLFSGDLGVRLTDLMAAPDLADRLEGGLVAQPLLFALQVGLVEALGAQGLAPAAVAGHSVGEVAAAWAAGILTLADAVTVIAVRARALEAIRGTGGMAAVLAGADQVAQVLADHGLQGLALAADNSPRSTTVSGDAAALEAFLRLAKGLRLAVRRLDVTYPYHGPAAEAIRAPLLAGLQGITPAPARVPFVSATTGAVATGESLGPEYWWHNARQPVQFRGAVAGLAGLGMGVFVEIGPRPVLRSYVVDTMQALGQAADVVGTLDRAAKGSETAASLVARALVHGASVAPERFFGPEAALSVDPPGIVWDHAPYRAAPSPDRIDLFGTTEAHPLLGARLRAGEGVWRAMIDLARLPWLADHQVDGAVVLPATGFVEIALAAGAEALGTPDLELRDLDILAPLAIDGDARLVLRTTLEDETGIVRIESRPHLTPREWTLHARGTLRARVGGARPPQAAPMDGEVLSVEALYAALGRSRLEYGPAFRRVRALRVAGDRAEVSLQSGTGGPGGQAALLDAALHAAHPLIVAAAGDVGTDPGVVYLPVHLGRVLVLGTGVAVSAELRLVRFSGPGVELTVTLFDGAGQPVVAVQGLRLRAIRLGRRDDVTGWWRQTLVPVRGPDEGGVLPELWADPATRLATLGLAVDAAPDPDVGALLIDAICRRIAWDLACGLADADGSVRCDGPGVAPDAVPLVARALTALQEDGALLADGLGGGRLAAECPYPPLGELIDALIAEAPARGAELMGLLRMRDRMLPGVARGLGGTALPLAATDLGPARRAIATAVQAVAQDLIDAWPPHRVCEMLVLGDLGPGAVARLTGSGCPTRLVLSHPDPRRVALMADQQGGVCEVIDSDAALAKPRHDVVLIAGCLADLGDRGIAAVAGALRPGGLVVAVEPQPDLATDLVQGQQAAWWSDTLLPEAPLGRRRGGTDWVKALAWAGLGGVGAWALADGAVAARLIVGRQTGVAGALPRGQVPGEEILLLHDGTPQGVALAEAVAGGLGAGVCLADAVDLALAGPPAPGGPRDLVLLAGLAGDSDPGLERTLLVQRLLALKPRRLWLVTRGGRPADRARGRATGLRVVRDAALWGFGRVAMNEWPEVETRLVDLDPGEPAPGYADRLAALLRSPGLEREMVLDRHGLAAPRIEAMPDPRQRLSGPVALALMQRREGAIDSLAWQPKPRRAPDATEVEIEVRATALNFRDVMWAQRLLPVEALEDGFAGPGLGMECAGIVVRAGSGSGHRVGERVVAFAPDAFASHVTVPGRVAASLPSGMVFETAAALPAVFVTASYALDTQARLQAGETVLIHGGAGGVGLAALQIAKGLGARVIATAGSPEKRALLRELGAEAVFDSRSLAFADQVRAATDGRGVDVVLNALAGEAMTRSLECLAPFGRFVELGKRDFYGNSRLALRPFRQNLSYFAIDADQLIRTRPDLTARLFADLGRRLANGALTPLPVQIYEAEEVVDAFRALQQAQHVGKIVVRAPRPDPVGEPAPRPGLGQGAWLIVGGLGGLGLCTAEWLADQGVTRLWLTSRSGQPDPADAPVLARLQARGLQVEVVAADVTDTGMMAAVVARLVQTGPLEGVVHAAMVLDDGLLVGLDPGRVSAVLRPKIEGAEILDRLTRPLQPQHFIVYSSVAAVFGNPGQAAYVAANQAVEALVARRRAQGLPGLAIAWGPIVDLGHLARDAQVREQILRRLGPGQLTGAEAMDRLGTLIAAGAAQPSVIVAPMRWGRLAGDLAILGTPLFERVDRHHDQGGALDQGGLVAALAELDDAAALGRLIEALVAETARILLQPERELDPYRPLTDLGFDSLMAVDLKMAAEDRIGIALPILTLGEGVTLADLAQKLLSRLRAGAVQASNPTADALIAQHVDTDDAAPVDPKVVDWVAARARRSHRGLVG